MGKCQGKHLWCKKVQSFSRLRITSPASRARFRLASSIRRTLPLPQSAAMCLPPNLSVQARAVPRASFTRLLTGAVAPLHTTLRVRWVSVPFIKFPPARHAQDTQSTIYAECAKSSCIPGFPCSPRRPRTPATPRPCESGTAFTRGLGGASEGPRRGFRLVALDPGIQEASL